MRRIAAFCFFSLTASMALADPEVWRDDVPLDSYLELLERIAPAARDGAQAYMSAFKTRCGRDMTTLELRRAIANGDGDPILLGMIRATAAKDPAALHALAERLGCPRRG